MNGRRFSILANPAHAFSLFSKFPIAQFSEFCVIFGRCPRLIGVLMLGFKGGRRVRIFVRFAYRQLRKILIPDIHPITISAQLIGPRFSPIYANSAPAFSHACEISQFPNLFGILCHFGRFPFLEFPFLILQFMEGPQIPHFCSFSMRRFRVF